ncbi:MAG: response regulator [bacterium]
MDITGSDILIVDDDPDILNACATTLRMRLYSVDTARNGYDAKNFLQANKYKVVLTDLKMPNITGIDLLKEIKGKSPETEVILFTAHGTLPEAVEAMKLGAYDFIIKPLDINQVNTSIKRCLEKHSLVKEIGGLKEVINLYEMSKAIVSITDIDQLCRIIVEQTVDILQAEAGALMLYNHREHSLEIKAADGLQKTLITGKKYILPEGISSHYSYADHALHIREDSDEYTYFANINPYTEAYHSVSLPILHKEKLLGVLNLSRITTEKAFTESEKKLLQICTSQISIALANSKLFEDLKQEKDKIELIFSGMHDGAVLLDENLHVTMVNQSTSKLLRIDPKDYFDQPIDTIQDVFHSSIDLKSLPAQNDTIISGDLVKKDDDSVVLELRAMKLSLEHPQWLLIIRDISIERKQEFFKKGILLLLSRKLKNPLTNINSQVTDLIDTSPPPHILKDSLKVIKNQTNILSEIIDKLMRFTLLETDTYALIRQNISLHKIIDQSLRMLPSLINLYRVKINVNNEILKLPPVYVDETKIQEIFEYLLENAIHYNDKETKEISIAGNVLTTGQVLIEISDNGPGIPHQDEPLIFKNIFEHNAQKISPEATLGLSLAMTKKIIEAHGGTIWVSSEPKMGSKFCFTLPTGVGTRHST